jgi:hypothetical protein
MSKINVRSFSNENEDGAPDLVGITTFSATSYFVPTRGTTEQRPSDHVEVGSLRYNYDTKNLEYYRGHTLGWSQFELIDPDLGGGTGSNTGLGTRGLYAGGATPSAETNRIGFITISTLGDGQDFGDLTVARFQLGGTASRTRAVFNFGEVTGSPNFNNTIDFVTIASTGNASDFGDGLGQKKKASATGSNTRAIFQGGYVQNTVSYVTIPSTGDAVDFGDLTENSERSSGLSSSTRAVRLGGRGPTSAMQDTIDFATISTTGNYTDFGNLSTAAADGSACSNSTRGIYFSGYTGSTYTNPIEYITIASTGNAVDFGDKTAVKAYTTSVSSPTRAIAMGGFSTTPSPAAFNVIEYVEIATTGDAVDFGDIDSGTAQSAAGASNGHGGL